jgi:hypothetical protein
MSSRVGAFRRGPKAVTFVGRNVAIEFRGRAAITAAAGFATNLVSPIEFKYDQRQ